MAPIKIRIQSSRGIAKTIMRPGSQTRRQMVARGNLAGVNYRRLGGRIFKYKDASYPFQSKRGEGQPSVLAKASFKTSVRTNGMMDISVTAPAAEWVERGNKPGPSNGKLMRIPVRKRNLRRRKGKFYLSGGARVTRGNDGKYYLFTRHVHPHKGYRLLYKSVRTAFRSIGRA